MSVQSIRLPPLPVPERLYPDCPPCDNDKRMLQKKTSHKGTRGSRTSRVGPASGYLSTWPAHMTSRITDEARSCFTKEKIRIHGCDDGLSGPPLGKPRFLELLEEHLRQELQDWNPELPKAHERKLQAYRDVFDYFIEDFRTYKPLLTSIKNEYESALGHLRDQIRELVPLRAQLAILSEESDLRIMALCKEEKEEVMKMKEECRNLEKVIDTMREEQKCLQAQVSCLEKDLRAQYLAYRDERDARNLLIDKVNCLANEKEQDHHEEHEEEDLLKLKLTLKVCREDMTRAQVELNQLQADYADVVPRRDWDNLERSHQENQEQLEVLQKDFDKLQAQHDTLVEEHQQAVQERDSLQAKLEGDRAYTPRPEWEKCSVLLGGSERWEEISADLSSQQLLELVLTELGVAPDVQEKEVALPLVATQSIGDDVPECLHYEGAFKKMSLKKADAVRVIKDVWKEKVTEDEQNEERNNLAEFLRRHLDRQHGERAGDWAYNLLQTCQQHREDDLIGLFYDILTGKVDESVHHGQTHMLSHLLKELIQSDATENGMLTNQEFSEALKRAFPLKEERDIEELVTAAETELGNSDGSISYQALYTEDSDGKHRDFLSLVKRQRSEERRQYVNQLRDQLGEKDMVELEDLKMAFKNIDPTLGQATLERYLGLAFQALPTQLEQSQAPLDTELALQRLLVADVNRAGPPPSPSPPQDPE
ncbi:translin-associated factor X-interacting protein 1 isoform X1 [Anguilla anguilla]|uniref:translin-associated factor X-interacting protein 1 isoform X1 n=2 Tax=Anguilla anguilla TaxID=7936 RepID=UPI0015B06423|nr:translin-associated factor X-interacting protein 1 isoform X1 [Anguilla anguilla]